MSAAYPAINQGRREGAPSSSREAGYFSSFDEQIHPAPNKAWKPHRMHELWSAESSGDPAIEISAGARSTTSWRPRWRLRRLLEATSLLSCATLVIGVPSNVLTVSPARSCRWYARGAFGCTRLIVTTVGDSGSGHASARPVHGRGP